MNSKGWRTSAPLVVAACFAFFSLVPHSRGVDPILDSANRSVSNSRQFVIYCRDATLRMAVSSFAEGAKASVLEVLGSADQWKIPIVITLRAPSTADPGRPLSTLAFLNTDAGPSIQIEVTLRPEEFKQVGFPQLIVRAVLLDIAYRRKPPGDGQYFNEAPQWLVEGLARRIQDRAAPSTTSKAHFFKQLLENGRPPKIREFLASNVGSMDSTSRSMYAACASAFLQMLCELPYGSASLLNLVRSLGDSNADPATRLLTHFSALKGSEASLEKWWTLGLARMAASERYLGLSVAETDSNLSKLLSLSISTDPKKDEPDLLSIEDYQKFAKWHTAKPALENCDNALAALMTQAHPLMRPVVSEYQRITQCLLRGDTKDLDKALKEISAYRAAVVKRASQITDYLNWYEATQMPEQSGAFDSYLKAAAEIQKQVPPKRNDPVSVYLDQVEREFE